MKTSLPIARLRALGCKVSTVIGHSPEISDHIYSVTLPTDVATRFDGTLANVNGRVVMSNYGVATLRLAQDGRLIVSACSYRSGRPTPGPDVRRRNESDAAGMLTRIGDALTKRSAVA